MNLSDATLVLLLAARIHGTILSFPVPQNFDCEIKLRFAVPHTMLLDARTQDLNSEVNCKSGALLNMMPLVSNILSSSIRSGITRAIAPKNNLADLKHDDPDLYAYLEQAHIQGSYCHFQNLDGLCLRIGWRPLAYAIESHMRDLIYNAPKATGPIGAFNYDLEIARFRAIAPREQSISDPTYAFPAKLLPSEQPPYESGDMSIFGGLLCLAGETEGCELVKRNQGADGRFWRSPNQIGKKGEGTFSGDQINGVFAYFATTNDPAAFSRYLGFIAGNAEPVPSPTSPVDMAYKSCTDDPFQKCMLAGSEWNFLNAIARKYGVTNQIPIDVRDPETKFGDQFDDLIWPATFAPRGFELHLIGVKIAIARLLGYHTSGLANAAAIIAAREPENPFFLYLHLGLDQSIITKLARKCYVDQNRKDYFQWQWERSEIGVDQAGRTPWDTSMSWDCVFMYSLLKNQVPIGP
ncbi:hypothetical protein JFU47_06440 [Pseudomonas sp. TH39(2020)]|uniref:hypothetical protein n=1 Tax=Pseudomonas sp. TH39(2020) TaxID=2796349 RepID=UPI001912BCA0|nr:hypothetical protein [Pseudomonas sp. TH39(2020)]MBK5396358.1 hypothetical protein [Pseudomonas sp. TH39(2020)]